MNNSRVLKGRVKKDFFSFCMFFSVIFNCSTEAVVVYKKSLLTRTNRRYDRLKSRRVDHKPNDSCRDVMNVKTYINAIVEIYKYISSRSIVSFFVSLARQASIYGFFSSSRVQHCYDERICLPSRRKSVSYDTGNINAKTFQLRA